MDGQTDGKFEGQTDEQTDKTNENYIPLRHTLYAGGINTLLRKSSAHISLKCALIRKIFYYIFFFQ